MWPAWEVTDRGFYYYDEMSSNREILFFDFATKRTRAVARTPGRPDPFCHNISVSPDEKDILYTQMGRGTADIVLARDSIDLIGEFELEAYCGPTASLR